MFKINDLFRKWLYDLERDEVPILVFVGAGLSACFSIMFLLAASNIDTKEYDISRILIMLTTFAPVSSCILAAAVWSKVSRVWQEYLLGISYILSILNTFIWGGLVCFGIMSIYLFIPIVVVGLIVFLGYFYVKKQEVSNGKQ